MGRKLSRNIYLKYNKEKECFEAMNENDVFEIFIDDLKDDVKEKLIEFLGGDNGNYDVIPLVTIENYPEEDE